MRSHFVSEKPILSSGVFQFSISPEDKKSTIVWVHWLLEEKTKNKRFYPRKITNLSPLIKILHDFFSKPSVLSKIEDEKTNWKKDKNENFGWNPMNRKGKKKSPTKNVFKEGYHKKSESAFSRKFKKR